MVNKIYSKILTFLVGIIYPSMPGQYRWYIRMGYMSRIYQLKFLYNDYIKKKPYKKINYNGEFSPELKFVLPFAYWHYKNGTLKKTVSSNDTAPFYYFSNNHIEKHKERIWNNFNYDISVPNAEDHNINYSFKRWLPVPLKEVYQNTDFVFKKPILIISNKYNEEWENAPVNYLDLDVLEEIITLTSDFYQIIYNRPQSSEIVDDNSKIHDLQDYSFLKDKFPECIILSELYISQSKKYSFNEFQLKAYANSSRFISVQGGNSTLASYFGGTNIIYAKQGHEIFFKEFQTIYPKLSGAKIIAADNYNDLIKEVKNEYLKK